MAGPMPSPLRSRASPAASPTRQKPIARQPPRRPAPHDVGVAAKRLEGKIPGQAARAAQRLDERIAPPGQVHARPGHAADADVQDVPLGEVPAVALEIRLHEQFGRPPGLAERFHAVGRQPRLALLGDHDFFPLRDLPERAGHGAPVAAGPDHDGGREDAPRAGHLYPARIAGHRGHARALAHVGAGGTGALEQVVVELPPDDAVAGRLPPARLVAPALEGQPAGREGLDGERVLLRVDLHVGQRLVSDPARADLRAGKGGRVEQQRPQAGPGQPSRPPRCRRARRPRR